MGNAVSNFVERAIAAVKDTVVNVFRSIAPPIVRYVVEHPIQSLAHVGSVALMLTPGAVVAPVLAIAGFTSGGVAAGSFAAAMQSTVGTIQAGGTFATLQSAAMGGYGAATVANAARVGAVAAEAINASNEWASKKSQVEDDDRGEADEC